MRPEHSSLARQPEEVRRWWRENTQHLSEQEYESAIWIASHPPQLPIDMVMPGDYPLMEWLAKQEEAGAPIWHHGW
jgi:hypothetical protein